MKPLSTSIYTFEKLIEGGYTYVDKTAEIYELIEEFSAQYFLARPRRFGKSLLISTLKAIFQGRRELFKGLALEKLDYDWQNHPVIHLDMGSCTGDTAEEVREKLRYRLRRAYEDNKVELCDDNEVIAFEHLVSELNQRSGGVVILVDEYDKPLLGHLGNESALEVQKILKSFYSVIKTTEALQRFALITGVSKFSKVSIFSDLNNLTDLTMQRGAATLLGYTQEEVESYFPEYIERLAEEMNKTPDAILGELKTWYNGYCFEESQPTVYNPVSLMRCLSERKFKNFWFETGTPTFLINLLKRQPIEPQNLNLPESAFSVYEPQQLEIIPLLVQTGYLTLKKLNIRGHRRTYELGYPNVEIEESFNMCIAKSFCELSDITLSDSITGLLDALDNGDMAKLMKHLKVFFAGIPYDIQLSNEKYYQTIFFVIFRLLGSIVEAESRSSDGRVDALLKTPERIVLFEFKLHGTAEEALAQINNKDYALSYEDDGRELIKVGVAFDSETRNLAEWIIE
ncbi:MAG: ATP-binding protein [Planctomycetes bacterium]|nr:ATP-binding protein [Planctomycetota bacterium]